MRIAVTGAGGFLGGRLARRLAADGHVVLALDRQMPEVPAGGQARGCDITDAASVHDAFTAFAPDAVVHLAALLTLEAQADIVAATRVNALGASHVFAEALGAGAKRIVYASSVAALGIADVSRGDRTVPDPRSVYGATKAFTEHLANAIAADYPACILIGLRYGYVYGPGRERGWRDMQIMIEAAQRGETSVVFPDYASAVDWTWIDDAVEVTARMVTTSLGESRVFNVAGDKRRMRDAAEHLARRFPSIEFIPQPAVTPPSAWDFFNDGLFDAIGFIPRTTMEEGIDRCLGSPAVTG
jgi:UDP-glucose 4-epimerase